MPLAGGTATRLNGALPVGGNVQSAQISPDSGRALYLADQDVAGKVELFAVLLSQLTEVSSANVWFGLATEADSDITFDLQTFVRVDGVIVATRKVKDVPGGPTGLGGAVMTVLPLALTGPVDLPPGSTVSIQLLVRNACHVSLQPTGTARLWFNGQIARSVLKTKIDNVSAKLFVRGFFKLKTGAGPSELLLDTAVGAPCGPFLPVGTWSITLP